MEQLGKLIVITGGTVAGKDTVSSELLKLNPSWKKVITTTTRSIRSEEKDGVDYHFLSVEDFKNLEAENGFLETVEYAGNFYGTQKSSLNPLFEGETLIWRIDPSRAAKVNIFFDNCFDAITAEKLKQITKVIYIKVPNAETLYKRFTSRKMTQDEIQKRLDQDEKDWKEGKFENVVINYDGKLEETLEKVTQIIS